MADVTRTSGWAGWIGFAAVITLLNGTFSVLQGFFALIGSNSYSAVVDGSLLVLDLTGWGWWNLVVGILLIAAGVSILNGALWARIVVAIVAGISAVGQLLLVPAEPWWSLIVIALDVVIIYAVTVHGREFAARD
ncbi:DUF7144 family membrane protein [Leifsonia sp. Leaf264]|uniref:DUF7144 family membrane protein n=1 Tax=Leifsonia sp. Leaf264 TaxID=1736314 RepID=UPI0006FDD507|nr:hypothetical protein [Leifsonia sp. Leaf264]KQO93797.1 hypothetical protein ASF30_21565 [Leifsonia sp. Leaf264]